MKLPKSYSWSNYLNLNRYYIKEVETIKKIIEKVSSTTQKISSHYGSYNAYHLEIMQAFPNISVEKAREVIRNIEFNADKMLDIINGGGNFAHGIIEIVKQEDKIIEEVLKKILLCHKI